MRDESRGGGPTEGRGRDEKVFTALDALREINQELRISARAAAQRVGLSAAQHFVLQQLASAPARSLNELAARTYTRHSSVSVVVSRLVERKLVERASAPGDARRITLTITPDGRTLLAHAPEPAQSRLIGAARRLPRAQLQALASGLHALVREMHASSQTRTRHPREIRRSRQVARRATCASRKRT
jgi:DNA-binding MarR family transcriptional regulator